MRKILNILFALTMLLFLSACNGSAVKDNQLPTDFAQKIELTVDGSKKTADPAPLITASFAGAHLMLSYLSDKDDIQFSVSAYMPDLQPGSYQVYDCKSASECGDGAPDNNQIASYGPYPKDPMPPLNLFRIAYYAPKLGLKPLTLVISSVKDEQQAGNPFNTKRVEGQLSGNLAYVEQEPGAYEWHVAGNIIQINGRFSVLCNIR